MVERVILCLCIIIMLSNSSFSLIAPFYPQEVEARKIPKIWTGFLMG